MLFVPTVVDMLQVQQKLATGGETACCWYCGQLEAHRKKRRGVGSGTTQYRLWMVNQSDY